MAKYFWKIVLIIAAGVAAAYFAVRMHKAELVSKKAPANSSSLENSIQEARSDNIAEKPADTPQTEEEPSADPDPQPVPDKFSLDIPFYSQAPFSKWDAFHEDMCEEASVLNAAYYLLGKKPSLEKYENELQAMQQTEKKEIGEWKSTTVEQLKKLVDIYFEGKIRSRIIESPTIEDIEVEIAAGHPVVVPLAGRDIGNPNFTPPGPVYHMLVVKGYDEKNFITNDVGTRKGNSYTYSKNVIMQNTHDWNAKDIHLGGKRVLILYR